VLCNTASRETQSTIDEQLLVSAMMFVADKINNAMVVVVVVMMREAKNVSEKKNCIHGGNDWLAFT
jgi:hypothetical protein